MKAALIAGASLLLVLACAGVKADDRVLSLASDAKSRNFEFRDGVPSGFFAEVLKEALAGAGWSIEFRMRPWARCFEEVRNGETDGLFSIYRIEERDRAFLFSNVPLFVAAEHFYVAKGHGFDARHWREALKGKRIGMLNGSYHGEAFAQAEAQHLFASIERVNTTESLVEMAAAGRIDAIFSTNELMEHAETATGKGAAIERVEPAVELMPTFLAFTRKRDMTAIRDAFDASLRKMKEDGRYEALLKRYAP